MWKPWIKFFHQNTHQIIQEKQAMKDSEKRKDLFINQSEIKLSLFDKELQDFIDGKLPKSHVFSLGRPSEILVKCGFPAEQRIELSASHLEFKSKLPRHQFDLKEVMGLEKALKNPIAVFEYGDRKKSQNVIVNIEKDGKNFLAGVHFNQSTRGYEVSDIRTLYPKENVEWLNWINQGKLIYGDKEKLQALIAQQRMNVAEVSSQVVQSPLHEHCLESALNILDSFGEVKNVFTDEYSFYEEVKKKSAIEQKFFNYYVSKGNLDARELSIFESEEFYNAIISGNAAKIDEYTKTDLHEINEIASELYESYSTEKQVEIHQDVSEIFQKNHPYQNKNQSKNTHQIIQEKQTMKDRKNESINYEIANTHNLLTAAKNNSLYCFHGEQNSNNEIVIKPKLYVGSLNNLPVKGINQLTIAQGFSMMKLKDNKVITAGEARAIGTEIKNPEKNFIGVTKINPVTSQYEVLKYYPESDVVDKEKLELEKEKIQSSEKVKHNIKLKDNTDIKLECKDCKTFSEFWGKYKTAAVANGELICSQSSIQNARDSLIRQLENTVQNAVYNQNKVLGKAMEKSYEKELRTVFPRPEPKKEIAQERTYEQNIDGYSL